MISMKYLKISKPLLHGIEWHASIQDIPMFKQDDFGTIINLF